MNVEVHQIAKVTRDLTEALSRLLPQLSPERTDFDREALCQLVASPHCRLFVATDEKSESQQTLGMLSLLTFPTLAGVRARIEDVVVDTQFRGQGVGKALLDRALTEAEALGALAVDLTSRPAREQANQLYLQMGFSLRNTNVYTYNMRSS